jgi:hypothetical protein
VPQRLERDVIGVVSNYQMFGPIGPLYKACVAFSVNLIISHGQAKAITHIVVTHAVMC